MNVKIIGLILALSIISIVIVNFFFSTDSSVSASSDFDYVVTSKAQSPKGNAEPASKAVSKATQQRIEIEADETLAHGGDDSLNVRSTYDENRNLEASFVQHGSLDSNKILAELKNDNTFSQLVGQLREQTSEVSKEKRMSYELQFYSQPLAQDGTVTLDTLECGTHLCFSELRAHNQASIDQFVAGLTKSDTFEAGVLVQLRGDPDAETVQPRRLIFSHDPEIHSIRMPRQFLKAGN